MTCISTSIQKLVNAYFQRQIQDFVVIIVIYYQNGEKQ